jgi:hypothetical protein
VAQAVLGAEQQEGCCLMLQPGKQTGGRFQTGEKRGEQGKPPWSGYPSIVCDSTLCARRETIGPAQAGQGKLSCVPPRSQRREPFTHLIG